MQYSIMVPSPRLAPANPSINGRFLSKNSFHRVEKSVCINIAIWRSLTSTSSGGVIVRHESFLEVTSSLLQLDI